MASVDLHQRGRKGGVAASGDGPQFDAVVVGAGVAGLYALYRLRRQGLRVRVYEEAAGVGGTWYWNRYPGARVDIESVEYSYAFSDELQQDWSWSERYASQPELLRYFNHVADRFDLRRDIQFETRVSCAAWDEENGWWVIRTSRGDCVTSRFCVMATGFLSAPKKPDINGLDSFAGETYVTSRWPHEGVDFSGKRVGIIGTGSSAIQVIPIVAQQAGHLYVLQRTPNFSVPLRNCRMDPVYERSVKDHYATWRHMERNSFGGFISVNFEPTPNSTRSALEVTPEERNREYEKRWQSGGLSFYTVFSDLLFDEQANESLAEFLRRKTRERIADPALAEKLVPRGYPVLTKRLCADTGYYETFNRDNVTLVDVKATPIEEVNAAGVRVGGAQYDLDALIVAVGFDAVTGALTTVDIRGRNGRPIRDHLAEGARNYLGLMCAGFPNLFMLNGPGCPAATFIPFRTAEFQVDWICDCLAHMDANGLASIDATRAAEDEWMAHGREIYERSLFSRSPTTAWYTGTNIPGKARGGLLMYLGPGSVYIQRCSDAAVNGYAGFVLQAKTGYQVAAAVCAIDPQTTRTGTC